MSSATAHPGNSADGVRIDDAPDNQVGGLAATDGNVISSNQGAGVYITGADATGNAIENNIIGLTAAGSAVLGNDEAGVANYSPGHADRSRQRHFGQFDRHLDLRCIGHGRRSSATT